MNNLDFGRIVIIAAALIFYLRLIIIQRQRVKNAATQATAQKKTLNKTDATKPDTRFAILSPYTQDRIIAGAGAAIALLGILIYWQIVRIPAVENYWWIATAAGILLFSWGFR